MQTAEDWLAFCAAEMDKAGLFFGHGTDNAEDEAAWMVLHVLGAPLDGSFADWDACLNASQAEALRKLLARRISERSPLAYLTGEARFCGLLFSVGPGTLVPRSPLAELIPERFSPWVDLSGGGRVLDMCTGGGCIAVAMAVHMGECEIDAVDISSQALKFAAENARRHGVADRVRLLQSDLFTSLEGGKYDLIVSNPPYVSAKSYAQLPAEYRAEPSGALVCGEDGLDIVLKILDASPTYMNPLGILVVEVGESAATLTELLPRLPFLWLDFSRGGEGIFLLEYEQLIACRADVRRVVEYRKNV
jgi:ribosomal protein L3 glutamine methyltransferase